jgi:2'-5' RNA ligase
MHRSAPEPTARRVFFALWPDTACAAGLEDWSQSLLPLCGGRAIGRDAVHMTLVFVGALPGAAVEDLRAMAAGVRGSRFRLRFDGIAWQRRQRIVWAQCGAAPTALRQLVEDLGRLLRNVGRTPEERPFKPHVTLLRNARCGAELPQIEPFEWMVGEFMLVESKLGRHGASYSALGRWALE